MVQSSDLPILLGGDFNLVRKIEEKSSGNVDLHMMDAFNEMINVTELREIQRTGSRFTWSNKQTPPIMCVLDMVLVSNSWKTNIILPRSLLHLGWALITTHLLSILELLFQLSSATLDSVSTG